MAGEDLVREAIMLANQNPMMSAAVGVGVVLFGGYYLYQRGGKKSTQRQPIETEPHERTDLVNKTPQFYKKKLSEDGQEVNQKLSQGAKDLGTVTTVATITVDSKLVGVEEEKSYQKDDEDEEDTDVEMYVMQVRPSGTLQNYSSYLKENILNQNSSRHIRVVRKSVVSDKGLGIYIPDDVEFFNLGGLQVEKSFAGVNVVTDVVLMKALERNINNIEEYVKKINHWSDNYSQKMGEYEKEIEADERRYGGKLGSR